MKVRAASHFGSAPHVLREGDIQEARNLGLIDHAIAVDEDRSSSTYSRVYDRQRDLDNEGCGSQRALQQRWREFAVKVGFQLYVTNNSTKAYGGNAKYGCKKLHGQQYFDHDADPATLECPFYVNVYGIDEEWKTTDVNLTHNHAMHVDFSSRPPAEGQIPFDGKNKRNVTYSQDQLSTMAMREMLPLHNNSTATMTGQATVTYFRYKAITISLAAASRFKMGIEDKIRGDRLENYQKLESYFVLMAEKNPGSVWRLEKSVDGTFQHACFIPSLGIQITRMCKKLLGFDGAHLKGEMNKHGVFLVATAKDYNNHIIPFALALVPVENYDNWRWFLDIVKGAIPDFDPFTALSDCEKGLLSAVADCFPDSGHHYCLYHIMGNINRQGASLTKDERKLICQLARSDCEADFQYFRSELFALRPKVVHYLDGIDVNHWVKYCFTDKFHLPTYDEITSNLSEQDKNNWIGNECRSAKP